MSDIPVESDFLAQLTAAIEKNISNEQFGVTELADVMSMSRSNLLRKVKKETGLAVNQLIRDVRLRRAMELLKKDSLNVSEVGFQVGFSSTSYFIKCFREQYGYPPGEVGKKPETEHVAVVRQKPSKNVFIIGAVGAVISILMVVYIFNKWPSFGRLPFDKSIAVLPFKNESNDSTNVYLINGLMESTLSNLQKIKDLRVVSRTSSEKYRGSNKSIPEMAKELNVSYFIEGSGQKIGDQILLHIQLIDASSDNHLWSAQYKRESKDIFQLQEEIAKSIAERIKVIITPEEEIKIGKRPTENLVAYDLFLKAKGFRALPGKENQQKAIAYFKKAIEQDQEFAMAYGEIAIAYYYMELFEANKLHTDEIGVYADRAFLYDPKLGESLIAKAVAYMAKKEYPSAVPYLEKALEYYPNSASVISFLSDFYAIFNLNTSKYLQYALKGVKLDVASQDSVTLSFTYLRLSNALVQNGFVDESLKYIDKSLEYNPKNPYSRYVRAFILFAKTGDAKQTRELLLTEYNKDTTRVDILQDIGKVSYYLKDYPRAYQYYKRFLAFRESHQLDIYKHENLTIAYVLAQVGEKTKSEELVKSYKEFIDVDKSIYHDLGLSAYYTYLGNKEKSVAHMKLFSKEDNVQYWIILFLESDPLMSTMISNPDFKKYFEDAKSRFWKMHEELKKTLEEEGLL
jgi:TolB-like protein/AraC-like DNA-binding protein/Tfp pilus assembly protein PilF